jgi:hypothetical protein
MAFEVTGSGSGNLKALEGWGWAQENAESTLYIGWTDGDLAALTGYGHNSENAQFPKATAVGLANSRSTCQQRLLAPRTP